MKIILYFVQFCLILILFLIFKLIGYKKASNLGSKIGRAIGETMLVTIAAGATPRLTFNPIESIQTMTAFIVQLALGEAAHGSVEYQSIYAVGILLFIITFAMNTMGHWIVRRWRNVY